MDEISYYVSQEDTFSEIDKIFLIIKSKKEEIDSKLIFQELKS